LRRTAKRWRPEFGLTIGGVFAGSGGELPGNYDFSLLTTAAGTSSNWARVERECEPDVVAQILPNNVVCRRHPPPSRRERRITNQLRLGALAISRGRGRPARRQADRAVAVARWNPKPLSLPPWPDVPRNVAPF
jgi:hypothetical protein